MQTSVYHPAVIDFVSEARQNVSVDGTITEVNAAVNSWHNNISNVVNNLNSGPPSELWIQNASLYLNGAPPSEEKKNELFQTINMIRELNSGIVDSTSPPDGQIGLPSYNQGSAGQLPPHTGDTIQTTQQHMQSAQNPEEMDYFDRVKQFVGDSSLAVSSARFGYNAMSAYESGGLASTTEGILEAAGVTVGEEASVGAVLATGLAPELAAASAFGIGALGVVEAGYGIYHALGGTERSPFLDTLNSGVRSFFDNVL